MRVLFSHNSLLGHLRHHISDAAPKPNSPADDVFRTIQPPEHTALIPKLTATQASVQLSTKDDTRGDNSISNALRNLSMLHLLSHVSPVTGNISSFKIKSFEVQRHDEGLLR